ncbi:TetR family transcriptional regulator [Bacillus thuringiensis serovar brasilensis]|uniref:TetR/AcrR family transcriptional regulator n=1 Tax=Bacillus cereus group TaxID=86661 RepID=UPI000A3CF61B|nr:TetR/AcrR family transcriptional regulator [Bacillus thuringiensis]MCU5031417.1 TetR/AcrR family transcriptional regulator [Bacillus cereus]MRA74154.1 TetR family transcriptional regulator [Bacillus thuringiensis]MRA92736.1 TetR family transcriptional regulator [Bacillus thuringiensis]MRC55318.1 TetR family transcriptional regulator [Bacillus thuringiensis]OTX35206.1 TetR family transcriptional regulator [Bacillus thuringiensis serovar brasilensis]
MKVKGETREKLIQTAAYLFQLQGYHATGLNQIIKESGSPRGSVYYHFPNGKEELAIEAIKYTGRCIEEQIKESMAQVLDPAEAIQHFIGVIANQFNDPKNIEGVPVGLLASETALINETLRCTCIEVFKTWTNVFAKKLVQHGFKQEEAEQLGLIINSMVEGGIMFSLAHKDKEPLLLISNKIPFIIQKKG